jgi:uncharacterized protein with ATP-grasp and redox domains
MKKNQVQIPSYISTGDPGSFAMKTILVRLPEILDQVMQLNRLPEVSDGENSESQLIALKKEIHVGQIEDPFETLSIENSVFQAEEVRVWREEIAKHAGKPWIGIPWYFAEAYFYLKLLLAFGYYDQGSPLYLKDPFQPHKDRELFSSGGGLEIGRRILQYLKELKDAQDIIRTLVFFSLWGNRIDLSNAQIAERSKEQILSRDGENLLIDHSQELIQKLLDAERIDIILDNSGSELVCDLVTTWFLLSSNDQLTISLHTKKAPFLVSDALQKDVDGIIKAFVKDEDAYLSEVGIKLTAFLEQQRLVIREHYFWNGPLHFPDFPKDIRDDLSQADLVMLKGDANYRRLLSDRKWHPSVCMEDITRYFPSSFAILRTIKGEIVVDLDEKMVAKLFNEDPQWMLNGKRGIVRVVQKV